MRRLIVTTSIALVALIPSFAAVGASESAPTGVYPEWTLEPSDASAQIHTGTLDFGTLAFPGATFTVSKSVDDGESVRLSDGTSAGEWMGAETPFGEIFGASGPSSTIQFLSTRVDTQYLGSVATTTVTFSSPVAAGALGFAVGDIDLDTLVIDGTDADGNAVTGAEFFGSTFNFCDVTVDIPTDCDGLTPPWPTPTWDASTRTVSYPTLDDIDGGIAWFQPTVSISTLTFTFEGDEGSAGSPSYRLWFAGLTASISGTVTFPAGSEAVPTSLTLRSADGSELATTTPAEDGSYSFDPAMAGPGYTVTIDVPEGLTVSGGESRVVDLSSGDAVVDFVFSATPVTPTFTG